MLREIPFGIAVVDQLRDDNRWPVYASCRIYMVYLPSCIYVMFQIQSITFFFLFLNIVDGIVDDTSMSQPSTVCFCF